MASVEPTGAKPQKSEPFVLCERSTTTTHATQIVGNLPADRGEAAQDRVGRIPSILPLGCFRGAPNLAAEVVLHFVGQIGLRRGTLVLPPSCCPPAGPSPRPTSRCTRPSTTCPFWPRFCWAIRMLSVAGGVRRVRTLGAHHARFARAPRVAEPADACRRCGTPMRIRVQAARRASPPQSANFVLEHPVRGRGDFALHHGRGPSLYGMKHRAFRDFAMPSPDLEWHCHRTLFRLRLGAREGHGHSEPPVAPSVGPSSTPPPPDQLVQRRPFDGLLRRAPSDLRRCSV